MLIPGCWASMDSDYLWLLSLAPSDLEGRFEMLFS